LLFLSLLFQQGESSANRLQFINPEGRCIASSFLKSELKNNFQNGQRVESMLNILECFDGTGASNLVNGLLNTKFNDIKGMKHRAHSQILK
jgi:hypothetical protein